MEKLTFVLPFTAKEMLTKDLLWRACVNKGALLRLAVLLHLFVRTFEQQELNVFLILCPANQCRYIEVLLRRITSDMRYQVIAEETWLLPLLSITGDELGIPGWYKQQILKMAASLHVSTSYYVSLDSDIICTRVFGASDLLRSDGYESKHLVSLELELDYLRIYHKPHAAREMIIKRRRYSCSADLLEHERAPKYRDQFYGETPCVINASKMLELLGYLESRSWRPWHDLLASIRGWTEYSLYFQYLEMTDALEKTCSFGNCNAVLDLERSVWQHADWYQSARSYDRDHFTSGCSSTNRGPFTAIQSWLSPCMWLPSTHSSIAHFYRDLVSWILDVQIDI